MHDLLSVQLTWLVVSRVQSIILMRLQSCNSIPALVHDQHHQSMVHRY